MLIGFLIGGWVWVPLTVIVTAALVRAADEGRRRARPTPAPAPTRPEPPTLWVWHPGHGRWVPTRYYAGDDQAIVRQLVGRA